MSGYFSEIYTGGKSLLIGLGVTFRAFIKPVVTVQYPREKIDVSPNIRGHIELIKCNDIEAKHDCRVCGMCAKNCPCNCIVVEGEKQEGVKGKVLTVFTVDFTKCSLCGLCVETCSRSALRFSNEYELAGFTREEFHFDLIKRLEEK
ncbi:MAG: NADH-quinone oxidoreductase subunit I [Proteobacteria bacterium]|nr:NADH-quinone oxidoreductase subunit I [Pseudomonadota bacterium]